MSVLYIHATVWLLFIIFWLGFHIGGRSENRKIVEAINNYFPNSHPFSKRELLKKCKK